MNNHVPPINLPQDSAIFCWCCINFDNVGCLDIELLQIRVKGRIFWLLTPIFDLHSRITEIESGQSTQERSVAELFSSQKDDYQSCCKQSIDNFVDKG